MTTGVASDPTRRATIHASHWIDQLQALKHRGPLVLVTVATVRGSAPREVGAKMIVGADFTTGTIGGGQLELQCQKIAEQQIKSGGDARQVRNFALGTNCGQCCGGAVDMLFETILSDQNEWVSTLAQARKNNLEVVVATPLSDPQAERYLFTSGDPADNPVTKRCAKLLNAGGAATTVKIRLDSESKCTYLLEPVRAPKHRIAVFGAGHVGSALVSTLRHLDFHIQWIDSRAELLVPPQLPDKLADELTDEFTNIDRICVANPADYVPHILPATFCLIMTHSHALDFELCTKLLQRSDITFCGLIGSQSKRKRFERLFKQAELPPTCLDRLTCPIGIDGVTGKKPAEIAISVTAQLLQLQTVGAQDRAQVTTQSPRRQQIVAIPH